MFAIPRLFKYACLLLVTTCSVHMTGTGRTGPESLGTVLYTAADAVVGARNWTDDERIELLCRAAVGSLVPTRVPNNAGDFLAYFRLIGEKTAKIRSTVGRKRATVMVADAIGAYLYARLLPAARALYYDGELEYSTAKRLHDLTRKIK